MNYFREKTTYKFGLNTPVAHLSLLGFSVENFKRFFFFETAKLRITLFPQKCHMLINPLSTNAPLLYPLKTSENRRLQIV